MLNSIPNAKTFMFAGHALFTVQNETTGNRFTFKVVQAHDQNTENLKPLWFVSVLSGPDNESSYTYMGSIREDLKLYRTRASKVSEDAQSWKVFTWLLKNANQLPTNVKLYHEGHCGRCGRTLTVPESITSGFGPECIKYV